MSNTKEEALITLGVLKLSERLHQVTQKNRECLKDGISINHDDLTRIHCQTINAIFDEYDFKNPVVLLLSSAIATISAGVISSCLRDISNINGTKIMDLLSAGLTKQLQLLNRCKDMD